MPIKIVHCADLHIGAAHSQLGSGGPRRAAEVLASLQTVIDLCHDTGAEALLIAGDLFDNPCPQKSDIESVKRYLSGACCPVFIVPGNHDYLTPSSPYAGEWGENIHIFTKADCIEFENFRVYGIPFTEAYCDGFSLPAAEPDGKINHRAFTFDYMNTVTDTDVYPPPAFLQG